MLADDADDFVAGDQLLDGGAGLLRQTLRILDDELDRPAEHAALIVEHFGDDFQSVLDLRALHHGTGRGLRHRHADLDRIRRVGACPKRGRQGEGGDRQMRYISH